MIRTFAPVWLSQHVSLTQHPFTRHAGTEKNIIEPAINIFRRKIMRPCYGWRVQHARRGGWSVAVTLGWPSVHELMLAPSNHLLCGSRVFVIVQVSQYNQVHVWIGPKCLLNFLAQNLCFLVPQFTFVCGGNCALGFQVSCDQREGIIGVHLYVHHRKPSTDSKALPVQQEIDICLRPD